VLTPELKTERLSIRDLCDAIRQPLEKDRRREFETLLNEAGIPRSRRARALHVLMDEQSGRKRFDQCWILRTQPGQSTFRSLREANAIQNGAGLLVAHTGHYLLWLASWAILGRLSFAGRMDGGWLAAWALLLVTLVPFQLLTTWLQGSFAIGLGGWLKRRMLCGALRLAPEEMRHCGIGSFIGQALEAESVEILAVSGGIAGLLAVIEIIMAMFLLGRFALVLAAWCALAVFAAWRFARRFQRWTATRMDMTQDLVENMVGHRTRLVQQKRADWHQAEDLALEGYLEVSRRLDRTGTWLVAAMPRGWLLAGLACLVPSVVAGNTVSSQTAILLGGILLAYTAFRKLTGSFADVAIAAVAWKRIKPLFDAAGRTQLTGEIPGGDKAETGQQVVEADRLTFRYRSTGNPALRQCSLAIRKGERILLEGPSGGGKTTFASLLSGMRQPESGLLLVNGLDRHTLGAQGWRQRVAAAPQFHENHILTETLAFNLLMGRRWPPTAEDMAEAETLCRELGLGDLLDHMPSGILQMVGECGWQLSHGERSRVYIARALLQGADLVILDESFAALDPENLKAALECTLERADTLMVIAHP
jgi:ATP-binding cassette subfamily B protein